MREQNGRFVLDLTWRGEAQRDVTIGKYDYGGLFLRMPWREGHRRRGRQRRAAAQRARRRPARHVDRRRRCRSTGRDDLAHIAIFDHPDNAGYPQPWRVDDQLGVGTARARAADWTIAANQTEVIRHRFVVYTGTLDDVEMTNAWTEYSGNRSTYSTAALWGDRAAGRARGDVPLAAGGRGEHDHAWPATRSTRGRPSRWSRSRWRSAGTIADGCGWRRTATTSRASQGFSNAGDSRILILEDTDRDGVADSRKVFLEGIPFPSAIAVGFDGLFLGAPPNLLFVPDRNGDDKADMADIEVRLTGWGISGSSRDDQQPALGTRRLAVRAAGLRHQLEDQEAARARAASTRHKEPFPDDLLQATGRRDQRRRLALSPDEGRLRGRRARLQQSVGHRLRRQGPAADQRLRDPAPLARHPRRHLPPPGRPALQSVRLQRHPDDRRSSPSLGARRRARLSVGRVSGVAGRAASSWPTSTSTRCSRTCWSGRDRASRRTTATTS